jgi:hypothetical protein
MLTGMSEGCGLGQCQNVIQTCGCRAMFTVLPGPKGPLAEFAKSSQFGKCPLCQTHALTLLADQLHRFGHRFCSPFVL